DRLGVPVEQLRGAGGDVTGHPAVDLLGQLDEPERVAQRADLVGQVVGVDGDAVPADAWAGVERLEPERLGGRARSWAGWRSRTPGCPGRSAPARRPGRTRSRRSARTPSPAAGGRSPRWYPDRWWTPGTPACRPSSAGP